MSAKSNRPAITYAEMSARVLYAPEDGRLFWREKPLIKGSLEPIKSWNTMFAGKPAFCTMDADGYLTGHLAGRTYFAHRVVWLLHYGEWPDQEIDHIDGDRTNNVISNLRDVPSKANSRNACLQRNNTSGHCGVAAVPRTRKWRAYINVDGKHISLGSYYSKEEAVAARAAANAREGFSSRHGMPFGSKPGVPS